jgi:acetyltransferase-like isoleucine patch superfamily enzyme
MDAWTPLKNTLVGCRVHARGTGNRIACAQTRQLSKATITIVGNGNSVVVAHDAQVRSLTVVIRGDGNQVWIGPSYLDGVGATISGNDNTIAIEGGCMLLSLGLVCEDDANSISIGASTQIHGSTELAAIEGTRLTVGEGCLFSGGISFRTGDSHSLTDREGRRINPSQDITIGDHVWIGMKATFLKGASVAGSSVVGACSVVSGRFDRPNCVIAGNPARVLQEGIDWRVER